MPPHDRGRMIEADVAIVGGGIHGCSTALHLARRGVRVVVIERDHVGRHASSANAGGVRTLLRHPAEIPLSLEAMRSGIIEAELGHDCGYHGAGAARGCAQRYNACRTGQAQRQVRSTGYEHEELVDADEVRRRPGHLHAGEGRAHCPQGRCRQPLSRYPRLPRCGHRRRRRMLEGCEVTDIEPAPANGWIVTHRHGRVKAASLLVNNAGAGAIASPQWSETPFRW
ncbi:MAG: FAD-dependent oxidoreductase [Geminicoccaceae bacterium]